PYAWLVLAVVTLPAASRVVTVALTSLLVASTDPGTLTLQVLAVHIHRSLVRLGTDGDRHRITRFTSLS
ncbi:hypothetical protein, partial [Pectobacterium atrosepticum]|uniref:hypothetical protein n=1 Tax=Pectobacterium atrosepticum TaxID=29471 RepID=UPI00137921C1